MIFDLSQVPFSRYGSYLAVSHLTSRSRGTETPPGLYLRTIHGDAGRRELFRLESGDDEPTAVAAPEVLRLNTGAGTAELCFATPQVLRIRGRGGALRLAAPEIARFDSIIKLAADRWLVNCWGAGQKFMLTRMKGNVDIDAPWDRVAATEMAIRLEPGDDKEYEVALEAFRPASTGKGLEPDFDSCVKAVREEFNAFRGRLPRVPDRYRSAADLAAYINWSGVVRPEGLFRRPAMLMSKNWMTNVWSWDHCFNALALAEGNPDLAWDQFMVMFDRQHESGALPDSVNDVVENWGFCKPPIHGWTLSKLIKTGCATEERLRDIYEPLARWTMWWFRAHDDDGDGVPQYNHGNDSGWDNSTVFAVRPPIESPDLAAFLILQLETLSQIALHLGRDGHSRQWEAQASDLLARLLEHFSRDGRLVALTSSTHQVVENGSLLLTLPVILGRRLPDSIREALVVDLGPDGPFLTEYGLATEEPGSPAYESDGYWRGPIWAPSTMLLVDGLAACGEEKLAKEIARRFCDMCAESGFAENFDALTGEGLRDRAYTWTSSVFFLLAGEYLSQ